MKKTRLILCSVIGLCLIISIVSIGYDLLSNDVFSDTHKPQITYGEFPFELVYEKDGKTNVVEDVLVCEYDGLAANAARGLYRTWKSYMKSGNTRITLFKSSDIEIYFTPNINHWEAGAFYMGDTSIYCSISEVFPDAWFTNDFGNKQVNSYIISADELWDKYKIKLISWEIAPPIKNTFQ